MKKFLFLAVIAFATASAASSCNPSWPISSKFYTTGWPQKVFPSWPMPTEPVYGWPVYSWPKEPIAVQSWPEPACSEPSWPTFPQHEELTDSLRKKKWHPAEK